MQKVHASATAPDAPTNVTASISNAKATVTTLAGSVVACGSGQDGTGSAAHICSPKAGAVDSAGNYFWSDNSPSSPSRIREVTPGGVVTTVAGVLTPFAGVLDGATNIAEFSQSSGTAVTSNGDVYVGDTQNCVIRKISGGLVSTLAGVPSVGGDFGTCDVPGYEKDGTTSTATFDNPDEVVFDKAGNLFVSSFLGCTIRKITPGGVVSTVAGSYHNCGEVDGVGTSAQISNPAGMAFDSVGNLFIADEGANACTIRKMTPAGVVSTLAGQAGNCGLGVDGTGSSAVFNVPSWIAIDSNDNLFVTDWLNHSIREITPDGVVTTVAGTLGKSGASNGTGDGALFTRPDGIAVDSSNNIIISDRYNNLIRKAVMNTNASVNVSFTPPLSNGGSVITGYTVTSFPAGGVDGDAGTTSTTHNITGLTDNTSYTFTVVATNAIGSSSPSVASSGVIPDLVPTRPLSPSVTPGNNQATLSWNAPSSNGDSAITHYLVYNKPTSSSNFSLPPMAGSMVQWSATQ